MPDKPRSFKEVVAAQDPAEQARLANADSFEDVTVTSPFHQKVTVIEDGDGGESRVEYFDDDGGCYVTAFAGPKAEKRARDYFEALKFGRLRAVRAYSSARSGSAGGGRPGRDGLVSETAEWLGKLNAARPYWSKRSTRSTPTKCC